MKIAPKRLGELVLRTSNVDTLSEFYINVVGLELYASFGNNRFLKVADDIEGHPQLLAIFDNSKEFHGPKNIEKGKSENGLGTLHHFAFTLEKDDFETEKQRLEEMKVEFVSEEYKVFGWHSIHFYDLDGNSLEFVCYDSKSINIEDNKKVRVSNNW